MPRFTLSKLFTPWAAASTPPTRKGFYRTRTEALTHSWWNAIFYFDGKAWWDLGSHSGLGCRREVKVLQWQGLNQPVPAAIASIRANLPKSAAARRRYLRFVTYLYAAAPVPTR